MGESGVTAVEESLPAQGAVRAGGVCWYTQKDSNLQPSDP